MDKMTKKSNENIISTYRKATFEYELHEKFEAGLVLTGTEVKSLRNKSVNLAGGFVDIKDGEAFIHQIKIEEYEFGNRQNHNPERKRKLLLHKQEIEKLEKMVTRQGFTIVPTKIYFQGAWVKIEIALAKGKKNYDKRQSEKEKSERRELRERLSY
jgi:SsrA-binding protein